MKLYQVLISLPLCLCEFNIDDSVLYKIDFTGLKSPQKDGDSSSGDTTKRLFDIPELETVTMTSKNNEQYYCTIPKVVDKRMEEENAYTGLHPLGLLEKLFIQQACAYRLESYWTYELCHGKFLRQYHEERDGKNIKVQEYFLGKFDKERYDELLAAHEKDVSEGITRHPPTKKLEHMNMPYYEVAMEDGTPCDLNNLPRRSRILYVCYPAGKNEIYSLKEVSTCEYEIVVLTSMLCSHPSYRPVESNEHSIGCRPVSEIGPRKPKMLQEIETESIKLRSEKMFEAHLMGGSKPGEVKIEIKPVQIDNVDEEQLAEAAKEEKSNLWKSTTMKEPFKPLMDAEVVKEFLKGEYCLYGGSGWWKYEFCYGKKVDQYHEEGKGQKTVINLGRFNIENHMDWLEQHPTKRPKQGDARKHVSHFYSGGDICDLTGKPRQIEVKLKCKKADSPSTVSLYLLEPKTCEYVLGVESPLVCDILPHADDNGMMPEDKLNDLAKQKVYVKDGTFLDESGKAIFGTFKLPFKTEEVVKDVRPDDNHKSPLTYDKRNDDKDEEIDAFEGEGFDEIRKARIAADAETKRKQKVKKAVNSLLIYLTSNPNLIRYEFPDPRKSKIKKDDVKIINQRDELANKKQKMDEDINDDDIEMPPKPNKNVNPMDFLDPGEDPVASHSESIFTEEEQRTFDEMKQRQKSKSAESDLNGDHSSKVTTSQVTKESVKIIDGVKTISKQMVINGKLVSSEQTKEYVGSTAAADEDKNENQEDGEE